ncbi:coat protein [Paris virus 2]|nr:coat protein [Paris virus 2]
MPPKAKPNMVRGRGRNRARGSGSGTTTSQRPQPSARGISQTTIGPRIPRPISQDVGSFSNSEIIMSVSPSKDRFGVTTIPLYPGRTVDITGAGFTWLPAQARLWSEYSWNHLWFSYTPSCSTQTSGNVVLVVSLDYYDAIPTALSSLSSNHGACVSPPYNSIYNVPVRTTNKVFRYVGSSAFDALSISDANVYSVGRLLVGTTAGDPSVTWGLLRAHYSLRLFNPNVGNALEANAFTTPMVL